VDSVPSDSVCALARAIDNFSEFEVAPKAVESLKFTNCRAASDLLVWAVAHIDNLGTAENSGNEMTRANRRNR
jgi:hypothetical protein